LDPACWTISTTASSARCPKSRLWPGDTITRGTDVPALNRQKKWDFVPVAKVGDKVAAGDVLGTVQETTAILHKIMVPNGISGTVTKIESGEHTVTDVVAAVKDEAGKDHELTMIQKWPVRVSRPYTKKFPPSRP
jgi:V/A-type H+-transporting ATPase subunit A